MKNFIFGAFLGLLCGIYFAASKENESDNADASTITALASIETPAEEVAPEIEEVVPESKPVVTHKPKKQKKERYYGRCMATTKRGTQCKRNAANGSYYCWQHQ